MQTSLGTINLSELLRAIQLFNSQGYHCDGSSEDGYAVGVDEGAQDCAPHSSDYNPQDWRINLSELLRLVQLYTTGPTTPAPTAKTASARGRSTAHRR